MVYLSFDAVSQKIYVPHMHTLLLPNVIYEISAIEFLVEDASKSFGFGHLPKQINHESNNLSALFWRLKI